MDIHGDDPLLLNMLDIDTRAHRHGITEGSQKT